MAVTVDQFGKSLVASGLLTAEELKALWNAIPAADRPKDGESFSSLLIQRERLNEFQARELLSGSGTPLVLGDYVLLSKIGAGGMGQVFKAQHRVMERLVAIKLLPAAMTKDEGAIKRFQREVKAAAKLAHTNIVQAYDASMQRGVWYLVMEYVDGQDLSAIVKQRGPLPVQEAVDYILQAARGLAFAHAEGVVHRDIKPANLLLDKKGVVKILDMGLARIDDGNTADHQLTNTGTVMGTVDYMPPEQANDTRKADARSDIYSLGCSLYRILTGESVFGGETVVQKIMAHMGDPIPSLLTKRPDCPAEIDRIFQKMLAKRPDDRYQQASLLVAELEAWRNPGATTSFSSPSATAMDPALSQFFGTMQKGSSVASPSGSQTMPVNDLTEALGNRPLKSLSGPEATLSSSHAEIGTDPKSQVVVPLTGAKPSPTATKTKAGGKGGKKPPVKLIVAGVLGVVILVVSGIIIKVRDKDGNIVAQIEVPEGTSAEVRPTVDVAPTGTASFSLGGTAAKPSGTSFLVSAPATPHIPMIYEPGGLAVDLLKHIEVSKGGTHQTGARNWEWQEFAKVLRAETSNRTVEIPIDFQPPTAYDLDIQLSPQSKGRSPYYCFGLASGSRRFALVVDRRDAGKLQDPGPWTGLQTLDGYPAMRNETSVKGEFISADAPSQLRIEVRSDGVRASINGKQLIDYRGNMDRLSPAYQRRDETQPNGATNSDLWLQVHEKTDFTKLTLTPLIGKPVTARSNATQPITDGGAIPTSPPLAVAPFDAAQAKAHQQAWAKHLGTDVAKPNSIGMQMTLIPPGEFLMGSTDEDITLAWKIAEETKLDKGSVDRIQEERPQHRVRITQPFRMAAHEVTIGQFAKFIEQSKYKTQAEEFGGNSSTTKPEEVKPDKLKATWRTPGYAATDDCPVTQVSWNDAVAFCNWLSSQENLEPCYYRRGWDTWALLPRANGYRLPTEAEWEYSCRAGTTTQYSFGDDWKEFDMHGWSNKNAHGRPRSVGLLPANPFGLYDMHGNVREWCLDWNDGKWYEKSPQDDPFGPNAPSARTVRGGSWYFPPVTGRSSYRIGINQASRGGSDGFRVALNSVGAPPSTASVTPQPALPIQQSLNNALQFDGSVENYVELSDIELNGLTALTVEATVEGRFQEETPFVIWTNNFGIDGLSMAGTADHLSAILHPRGVKQLASTMQRSLTPGRHHLAMVYASNELRLYVDGKQSNAGRAEGNQPLANVSRKGLRLGAQLAAMQTTGGPNAKAALKGRMDEIRISKVARYGEDFAPAVRFETDADTLALYHCDEGAGDVLRDDSGNNHHGKITGAKWVRADDSLIATASTAVTTTPAVPGSSSPPTALDVRRRTAERILAKYGNVHFRLPSRTKTQFVTTPAEIPAGEFAIAALSIANHIVADGTRAPTLISDAELAELVALPGLEAVELVTLDWSKLSPDGIKLLARLPRLDYLVVTGSNPNPAAWNALITLTNLQSLDLQGAVVGEHGTRVGELRALPKLQMVGLTYAHTANIADAVAALRDLPTLTHLALNNMQLKDEALSKVLQIRQLTRLNLATSSLTDEQLARLSELKNLRQLFVRETRVTPAAIAALQKALPACKIDWNDPAKATTPKPNSSSKLFMHDPAFPQWMAEVRAMPAEEQIKAVSKKLMELNPGFDGKLTSANGSGTPSIASGVVNSLGIIVNDVTDVSPVRALTGVKYLAFGGSGFAKGKLADLSPLQGTSLTNFIVYQVAISDLSPLAECRSLNLVKLTETKVTAAGVAALQQSLPNCKIEWDQKTDTPARNRRLAEWIVSNKAKGWTLLVVFDNKPLNIDDLRQLPSEPFVVNSVGMGKSATDDDLIRVGECIEMSSLHLNGSPITDKGVAHLEGLTSLKILNLSDTGVSDSGIAHLAALSNLEILSLLRTNVSDRGLPPLHQLTGLKQLVLKKTKVTAAGVTALQKALPNCKIEWDDPAKATTPKPAMSGTK